MSSIIPAKNNFNVSWNMFKKKKKRRFHGTKAPNTLSLQRKFVIIYLFVLRKLQETKKQEHKQELKGVDFSTTNEVREDGVDECGNVAEKTAQ